MTQDSTAPRRKNLPIAQRRVALVDAAVRVLERDGAAALTARAVADEAGVALGSVHYAFATMKDLLAAVFIADTRRAIGALDDALNGGGTVEAILTRAGLACAQQVIDRPELEMAMQELTVIGARDNDLRAVANDVTLLYRRETRRFLERVAEDAGAQWNSDIEVLAETVSGTLFGLSLNWLCTRDDALLRACVTEQAAALAQRLVPITEQR